MACGLMLSGCGEKDTKEETEAQPQETVAETAEETQAQETEEQEENEDSEDSAAQATAPDASAADASPAEASAADAQKPDYDPLDYVQLGEYKGIEITVDPIEVTEEEIDEEIESAIIRSGKREELEEGTVENGDIAVIDFVGKKDGVAFDGGTSKDYELEIGSNTFIDGFEEGVEGMEVGETKDLELTFPENYPSEDLAGEEVIFEVTVNAIRRIPELTDELAAELSDESETVEELREEVRSALEENKKSQQENTEMQSIYSQLVQESVIKDYPQDVLEYQMNLTTRSYEQLAEQYGMTLADFTEMMMGRTLEQFNQDVEAAAQTTLRQEMLLTAIAQIEGIEISEEEYEEGLEMYTTQYGFESEEAFLEANSEEVVREALLQNKVMQFLLDNAVITEATSADAQATAPDAESSTQTDAQEETEEE